MEDHPGRPDVAPFIRGVEDEEPQTTVVWRVDVPYLSLLPDKAIEKANSLPYGLAAYAFTRSARNADRLAEGVEAGNLSINHFVASIAETPFGGVKESGHGSEGGIEGLGAYLVTKFISQG